MRVTFISMYSSVGWESTTRLLSAVLKKQGYETRLLFIPISAGQTSFENDRLKHLVELSSGSILICISVMTNFFSAAAKISQMLHRELSIPIIWGGIHPTLRPNECMEYSDMVCIGEGEEVLVNLVKCLEKGDDISGISGLGYRRSGKVFINYPSQLIQNLDLLPFPDYECEDDYLLLGGVHKIDKDILRDRMFRNTHTSKEKYHIYHSITSRGCKFACTYCCNNALRKIYPQYFKIRRKSIDSVISEFVTARHALPFIDCILINDDDFFSRSKDEISLFAEEYRKRVNLPLWLTGVYVSEFDKIKFELLVNAGLKFIRVGIQTGSEKTKKMYRRNYSNKQVINMAKEISKFRDKVAPPSFDIIIDNPWESDSDLVQTLTLLCSLPKPCRFELFSLTFFPGTDLYDRAKNEGIIKNDVEEVYDTSFYSLKPNPLNKIFILVGLYAKKGWFFPPWFLFFLVNPVMRGLGIDRIFYSLLFRALYFRKYIKMIINKVCPDVLGK